MKAILRRPDLRLLQRDSCGRRAGLILAIAAGAAGLRAAGADPGLPEWIPPLPALVAYAGSHGIPLDGIEAPAPGTAARAGDRVTTLVTLRESGALRQWLVQIRLDNLTEAERAKGDSYTITMDGAGYSLKYSRKADLALAIRTIGPFTSERPQPAHEQEARALVGTEFLALGFADALQLSIDKGKTKIGEDGRTGAGDANGSTAKIFASEAEARSFFGMFPALYEFFNAVQRTPGLQDILWDLVEKPSLWSIARHLGIHPGIGVNDVAIVESGDWGTGGTVYRFTLNLALNDHPAVSSVLVVTVPRPPLLATAGVIGLSATPPDDPGKRLDLHVLSARRAAAE